LMTSHGVATQRFNAKPNPAEKKRVKPPKSVREGKLRPKEAVSPRRLDTP
jgi:hypothetical protein